MLRLCLALVATAQLGRSAPAPPQPAGAQCIEHVCFGVFWGRQRFPGAGRLCQAGGGQLMTVRSTVAEAAIALLVRNRSDASLWIGLQLPAGQACSDPARPLRGFRWVTGDERTDYTRWRPGGRVCGSQCVSVAAPELTWEEKRCDSEADGFLCEYSYPGTCPKLSPGAGVAVTYTTPFGAQDSDLLVLPPQTTASVPALGVELVCQEHSSGGMRWSSASPGAWHCQLENGGCEASCQWDGGTPRCTCPQGKQLDQDQRSCSSLCANAPCEHHCIPLTVNFTCMCHEGYELAEDGISCRDIDDCKTKPDLCDQVCINTDGGFRCQCHSGYELVEGKCEDVIDCYEEKCHHWCVDVPGGYKCSCFSGYAPSLQDPNKCVQFCNQTECPADCDPHTQDTCYCPDGFVLDHYNGSTKMCVDIDECEQSYCDQLCTNKPGSYTCHCQEGYSLHKEHKCISEDEFSGETESYPTTAAPTHVPPKSDSLHPGVLIGISIGILSTILVLMAILYHLMKKHFPGHGAMDYKCSNRTEKEVVLQQVPPGCPSASQKL
ncbi:thrombomodulin [Gopherus flavomarginatus]|uniref:thrombomodulin n=1 Tax=Gopherus flavomarginatus TaxID=286002 RepID=UPI0021CBE8BB|nr:thrombomodulin [Gopherus flavomarginatus]